MMTREELLEDEFVRAKPPGIRLFSLGMFKLARKLKVRRAMQEEEAKLLDHDGSKDSGFLAYLMDERNSEQCIREFADAGREAGLPVIEAFEMNISLVFVERCMNEVRRTEEALGSLGYRVEAKPGDKPGAVPSGKS